MSGPGRGQRAAIQRARIIEAMVQLVCECGYAGVSVSLLSTRAKVSRRTFYESFDGLDECFLALLEESAAAHARVVLARLVEGSEQSCDGDIPVPPMLRDPRAYRARGCLLYLADHPGASNRQIADGIGVAGDAQMSILLARLDDRGLLAKVPVRRGYPNAWALTRYGAQVSEAVRSRSDERAPVEVGCTYSTVKFGHVCD